MNKKLIFSFDMGTGSIGECVRQGEEVKHLDVLLIDNDYADTKDLAKIRRGYRTRKAHKVREDWWRKQAVSAGIEVLETGQPMKVTNKNSNPGQNIKPDERMLRQFSAEGDSTIYNPVLIRIALLQGKKLKGWQIFKAIWSAIQHRGYDDNLPWATGYKGVENEEENQPQKENKKSKKDDDKENTEGILAYKNRLEQFFGDETKFHLPCYYEAKCMGIWDRNNPDDLNGRLGANPESARNKDKKAVIPRQLIEKEIEELLKQAAKQYPKLKGKEKFIMYGEGEEKYASFKNEKFKKFRGTKWDWDGLLGQKIPRFDNRIISKCCLIPRFNVCKADKPLNQDITVLMQLLNMRFFREGIESSLKVRELTDIFEKHEKNIVRKGEKKSHKKVITNTKWEETIKNMGCISSPAKAEIDQPKAGGRSRFCMPALTILKDLIFSGKNPHDYYNEIIKTISNTDKMKGLVVDDYAFLLNMPNEWSKIHIPDDRYELKDISDTNEKNKKISEILGDINNPIVKHRLELFLKRLKELEKIHGKPDKVFLEIAREEFMSEEKKKEYTKNQKRNKKEIENAENEVNAKNVFKMRLFKEQNGMDVYELGKERALQQTSLDVYEIDHITPRSIGGSDSIVNKVLTKPELNQSKGNKTPYQWFSEQGKLKEFIKHIKGIKSLKHNKVNLLISQDAGKIEKIKTDLQATMYLEKLTQKLVCLYFGWGQQTKDDERKVYFVTGGRTAQIRNKLRLNEILHSDQSDEKQNDKKNRKNDKHHALDALVISVANEIKYDEKDRREYPPEFFTAEYCRNLLNNVYPEQIKFSKPKLRETIYGLRKRMEKDKKGAVKEYWYMVSRFNSSVENFRKLADSKKNDAIHNVKSIFDLKIKKDFEKKLRQENLSQEEWEKFLNEYTDNGKRIKKIATIDSKCFSRSDVFDENGRKKEIIGEYKSMGKIDGQYLKAKVAHKGQIIYCKGKNKKGENQCGVEPVYVFDSIPEKLKEMKKQHGKVWFFQTGITVELQNDIPNDKDDKFIRKGIYKLRTIISTGQAKIESMENQKEYISNINKLMDIGKMQHYRK